MRMSDGGSAAQSMIHGESDSILSSNNQRAHSVSAGPVLAKKCRIGIGSTPQMSVYSTNRAGSHRSVRCSREIQEHIFGYASSLRCSALIEVHIRLMNNTWRDNLVET